MLREKLRKFESLRKTKIFLQSTSENCGSLLLKNAQVRSLFNSIYNTSIGSYLTLPLLGKPKLDSQFHWKVKFRNAEILFPVLPDLERSWNAALAWGWSGNKQVRAFYEFYLENNDAGVFWDIGANDGTHTYLFASQGYNCLCFEPQPSCIPYIDRVIELNHFDNIKVLQTALGNQDSGTIEFFISESSWYSSTKRESVERFEKATSIKVPISKLDSFWQKEREKPDLVKIDVEGFEWDVIKGGLEFFQAVKPVILIEVDMTTDNLEKIYNFFHPLDCKFYHLKHDKSPFIEEISDELNLNSFVKKGNLDFIILPAGSFRDKFERSLMRKTFS